MDDAPLRAGGDQDRRRHSGLGGGPQRGPDPAPSLTSTSTSAVSNRSGWRLRMAASRSTSCRPGWTRNARRLWKWLFCTGPLFMTGARRLWPSTLKPLSFDSRSPILPGETVSGFVVNRADPGMMVQVDLIGREWSDSIGLVVPVQEPRRRSMIAALRGLYTESDIVEIDDEPALRSALEALPLLRGRPDQVPSLPLNGAIGKLDEWGPAFVGRNYRYAPASPWRLRADAGSFRA